MTALFQRTKWFIWPPSEANFAEKYLDKVILEQLPDSLRDVENQIRSALRKRDDINEIYEWVKSIYDSESKRRETLEDKVTFYISAFSFTIGIVTLIPALFAPKWSISSPINVLVGIAFLIAIIYILTSVVYAMRARQVEGLAFPTTDEFLMGIREKSELPVAKIVQLVQCVKYNEPRLNKKSNNVSVSEATFVRGIMVLVIGFIIAVVSSLIAQTDHPPSIKTTGIALCQVPDLVGLEASLAEQIVTALSLEQIKRFMFIDRFPSDIVIAQEPIAGSLLQPCEGIIHTTISNGLKQIPTHTSTPTLLPLKTITVNPP